jgi:hypothetical protein
MNYSQITGSTLSNFSTNIPQPKNLTNKNEFDHYKPLRNRINAGEACTLLRDHTISEYYIIPNEVVHIIREINCKSAC